MSAYTMATTYTRPDGVEVKPDEIVDAAYVRRFTEARDFFEGLGGTEEHSTLAGGIIRVVATAPDGTTVRETIFTPVH